jgi:hypothetical protein
MQCGCEFFYPDRDKDGSILPDELEEWSEVRATRERLARYLHDTATANGALELLMVWDGVQSKASKRIGDLTPEAFLAESFPLDDFQLALVREEPDRRAVDDRNAL